MEANDQTNDSNQTKPSTGARIALVIVALFVLFWLFGSDEPTSSSSSDNLPIVDGAFKDCLIRNGYASAYDLDQLAVNGRAIDACE